MNIATYLKEQEIDFDVVTHRTTYSAQKMAEALHVPGRDVAKTVLLRADHGYPYIVAVLPATRRIDFRRASEVLGGSELELATENEVSQHCPDCEIGALPPFGSQFGMKTLVDRSLADEERIFFEGNTHDESIRMSFDDFRRLEQPLISDFAH